MSIVDELQQISDSRVAPAVAEYVRQGLLNRGAPAPAPVAAPPPPSQNGVLTDIGHGLAAGAMVDLPRMAGQAMQAFGVAPETGQQWAQAATAREQDPLYQTSGVWGAGARGVAPALGTMAVGLAGAPLGALGVAAAGGVAAGALFGGSTYQDIYQRALAAGADPGTAHDAALKGGAVMGVGQAAASAVGGRILAGAGGALASAVLKKGAAQNALDSFSNPSFLKSFGVNFAEMMGTQLLVQTGSAAALNTIEQGAGINTGRTSWEAAKETFAPTAAMTTLLAPVGLWGARLQAKHRAALADSVSGAQATPEQLGGQDAKLDRTRNLAMMAREMRRVAPKDQVIAWQQEAQVAINRGEPVNVHDVNFNADNASAERAQAASVEQQRQAAETLAQQAEAQRQLDEQNAATTLQGREDPNQLRLPNPGVRLPDRSSAEPPSAANFYGFDPAKKLVAENEARWRMRDATEADRAQWMQKALAGPDLPTVDPKLLEQLPDIHPDLIEANKQRWARLPEGEREQIGYELAQRQLQARELGQNVETVDYSKTPVPGDESVTLGTARGAAREQVKANRQIVAERIARNTYPSADGMEVRDLGPREEINHDVAPDYALAQEQLDRRSKQQLVDGLKTELPRVPVRVREKLAEAQGDPLQEAKLARQIAEENAGSTAKWVATVGEFANKREAANANRSANQPAEAAAAAKAGDKPEPVAVSPAAKTAAGGEQVPAAARGTEPGATRGTTAQDARGPTAAEVAAAIGAYETPPDVSQLRGADMPGTVETGKGEVSYATTGRQGELQPQRQGGNAGGQAAEAGSGNRLQQAPARRTEAQVKAEREVRRQQEVAAREGERQQGLVKKTPEQDAAIEQATRKLALHDKLTGMLQQQYRDLWEQKQTAEEAGRNITNEHYAKLNQLERQIQDRLSAREALQQDYSDAIGGAEKAKEGEPAWTAGYHSFTDPAARQIGERGEAGFHHDTLQWLASRKAAGEKLSKEEEWLIAQRGGMEKRGVKATDEAKLAVQEVDKAKLRDYWQGRSEQLYKAYGKADAMYMRARAEEARALKQVRDENEMRAEEALALRSLAASEARALRDTPEQFAQDTEQQLRGVDAVIAKLAAIIDRRGVQKRGLATFHDPQLAALVASDPHASVMMDHIAQHHSDPTVRAVARMLADESPNAVIIAADHPDFNGGRYRPNTHEIEIGRGGMNPVTLMHETTHALTHNALWRAIGNEDRGALELSAREQREVAALKELRGVMDRFQQRADMRNPEHALALENEHEFLAEALNNPAIQAELGGRSGLWTRFVNVIRNLLHMPEKQTDLERLLTITPTFFDSPRRNSLAVFHSAVMRGATDENGNKRNSPWGLLGMLKETTERLRGATQTMSGPNTDTRRGAREAMLSITTVNHQMQMLRRQIDGYKTQFPEHSAKFEQMFEAVNGPWKVMQQRSAMSQQLLNGAMEANPHMREMTKVFNKDKKTFGAVTEIWRRARQANVDPRDATLADAQKRSKDVTAEMFNAPLAQQVRQEWAKYRNTPYGKLYDQLRTYSELQLARAHSAQLDNIRSAFGLERDPDLYWWKHITGADGRSELKPQIQLDKLNGAITGTYGKTAEDAKLMGNSAKDYTIAVRSLVKQYNQQRSRPYVHFGRSGDYFIHFDVRPEFYDRVRTIVSGELGKGGLSRDMGPDTGMRTVDMRFENELQYAAAHKLLQSLNDQGAFKIDNKEEGTRDTYGHGRTLERWQKTDGATPTWMRKMKDRIMDHPDFDKGTKEQILRELSDAYYQAMPETSPLKAQMFADLAHGSSKDFVETWAKRTTMANHSLVGAFTASHMGEAVNRLNKSMTDINNTSELTIPAVRLASYAQEMKQRVADMQTAVNTPTVDMLRAATAPWYLAANPAYLLMTGYQPWQATLPKLGSRYGYVSSAGTMARSYGRAWGAINYLFKNAWDVNEGSGKWKQLVDAASPEVDLTRVKNPDGSFVFSGAQLEMMKQLQYSNLINFGQTQQIIRPQTVSGAELTLGKVQQVNRVASLLPHFIEMTNRLVAALSAHELELTRGAKNEAERQRMMDNATPEQRKRAIEMAITTIRDTDGDHSQANIARMFGRRGALRGATPMVVGFNQYDFQMTEMLGRTILSALKGPERAMAAKQLAGMFAMTGMMAGALGMPLVGMYTALHNMIASAFQDPEDTPPDFEKSVRNVIDMAVGKDAGQIIARGVPRALDVDMSARSGWQDVAPFTDFLRDRQKLGDRIKDHALDFLGPTVGIGAGLAMGARHAYEGNYPMAINEALPTFMRNFAKSYRMSQYGFERQGAANEQIPLNVSTWNIIAQAGGLTSGRKAEETEKQFQWTTNQTLMQDRLSIIRNNWLRAMDHGDAREVSNQFENIIRFATSQPQYMAAPSGLGGAFKQRMSDVALAAQTGGVRVPKGVLPWYMGFQGGGLPTMSQ